MDKKTARKFMGKIEDIASGLAKYVSNDSGEWNDMVANRALKSLQAACDHLEDIEESYRPRRREEEEIWEDGKIRQNTRRDKMRTTIVNAYGKVLDYDSAVMMMDDDLREELHSKLAPCTAQEFFDAYAAAHKALFGEDWVLDGPNPMW